jgi:hypothetical protein
MVSLSEALSKPIFVSRYILWSRRLESTPEALSVSFSDKWYRK